MNTYGNGYDPNVQMVSFHPTSWDIRWQEMTLWERFHFWVEQDAVRLGMDLVTYYFLCSLCGAIKAFCLMVAVGII